MPLIPHQESCFPLFTTIHLKKESCGACKENWLMNVLRYAEINPLSPDIHKQILQTDLYTFL